MGTPDFAAVILRRLLGWPGAEVLCVYTQPDRPAGRGREPKPSPVKLAALEAQVEVRQPLNFKDQAEVDALRQLAPDVLIVAAYGLILPQAVMTSSRKWEKDGVAYTIARNWVIQTLYLLGVPAERLVRYYYKGWSPK